MGASQSSQDGGTGKSSKSRPQTKDGIDLQDYYALLELPDPASLLSSADDIRKSYRRLALRYHPDKNPDDIESANERFRLVQAAYEVLSDDQERAWYDTHRDQILGGFMDDDDVDLDEGFDEDTFQNFRSGKSRPPPAPTGSHLPGLTPRQLMRFLDASLCIDVTRPSSDETGFFGTFRRLFERLDEEEKGAAPYPGETSFPHEEMPSFAYSHTPYLHPKGSEPTVHQSQVRDFYAAWGSFVTRKGFAWRDGYRTTDAPDRRVKRAMEKENKRMRDAARREYNDVVRSLVAFIRKRDPRVKAHIASQSNATTSAEELRRRREAAEREMKEQETRARSYRQQAWDAWENAAESDSEYDSEGSFGEQLPPNHEGVEDAQGEDNSFAMLECFACEKTFQSEAAFANHEKSNKHKKEVQRLTREMQREDRDLHESMQGLDINDNKLSEGENEAGHEQAQEEDPTAGMSKKARQKWKKRKKEQEKVTATQHESKQNASLAQEDLIPPSPFVEAEQTNHTSPTYQHLEAMSAPGEKKSRRSKKAAKADFKAKERCNVCSVPFESRSKLFLHIRETGHALASSTSSKR